MQGDFNLSIVKQFDAVSSIGVDRYLEKRDYCKSKLEHNVLVRYNSVCGLLCMKDGEISEIREEASSKFPAGKIHRLDGPAIINTDLKTFLSFKFYINGEKKKMEEFYKHEEVGNDTKKQILKAVL